MRNRAGFFGLCGLVLLMSFANTAAGADSLVVVTTQAGQGADDFVLWAQLGGDATSLGATFNATSAVAGIAVAGTLAGPNSLISVVCPASPCSWTGVGLLPTDGLIWTSDAGNSGNGPVSLVFGTPITGVGALVQANAPGQFTAQIQAFNGATLLGTFPLTSDPAGDAVYLGVQDQTAPNITKVVFSITACAPVDSSGCTDFAIDTLNLNQGAAVASFSPRSLSFGVVPLGTTSPQGTVTLINTGGAFLQVSALAVAGGNSGDFNLSQNCPASLGPGAGCALKITFKPTGAGPRKASIAVSSSAAGNAPAIILTGVGSAGGPSPTSLTFASQTVGTPSAAKVVTFTNNGSSTMNLWQIAILGANAGDFSQTNTCGGTLGAGANCTVSVTFKPTVGGIRTASVLFSDDGGGSPHVVILMGTGLTPPGVITLGQTVSGNLSIAAPNADCNSGTPADRWSFNLPALTTVTIALSSTAFDTFVCLLNSSNALLTQDDDSGGNLNSQTTITLPAGNYVIEATSFSGSSTGNYSLSLQPATIVSPGPIGLGQTVVGNLSTTAPKGQCLGTTPVDRYSFSFSLPPTTTLTIDLASSAFDTFVCLLNSANQVIASDANRGAGTNSRLVVTLTTGSYFIEVTTQSPGGAGGTYTLSLQQGLPPAKPITVSQTLSGNLSSTAAEGQCLGTTPIVRYGFTLPATTTLTIDLASSAFDTFVCLLNSANQVIASDDNRGPGANSRLVVTLTTGSYFVEVTTVSSGFAGGTYTLSVQPGLPPAKLITVSQTLSGNLSSTAAEGQCLGTTPVDRYMFSLPGTTTLTIDLASSAFDTFVCLLNSANQVIASDDNRGPGTNSRLVVTLLAGSYFIEVTTVSPGFAGGSYTVSLQPGLPPAIPIALGQTLSGNLSSTAAEGQCLGTTPVDRYGFTLAGTTTLTIDLASSAFDTFVCLLNNANQVINSDDNGGGGTNSRLVVTLLAGSYFIEVTTVSPGFAGGPYTLFLH